MAADLLLESESATSAARHAARRPGRRAPRTPPAADQPGRLRLRRRLLDRSPRPRSRCTAASPSPGRIPPTSTCAAPAPTPSCSARRPSTASAILRTAGSLTMADGNARPTKPCATRSRAWLADNWKGCQAAARAGGAGWTDAPEQTAWLAQGGGGALGGAALAGRMVRPRPVRRPGADHRARIRRRRRAGHRPGPHQPLGQHRAGLRHARVQGQDRAGAAEERGRHVPALLRARRRVGPGRHPHPGRHGRATTSSSTARRSGPRARPPPTTAC